MCILAQSLGALIVYLGLDVKNSIQITLKLEGEMKRITYLSRSHCSANDIRVLSLIRTCDRRNQVLGVTGQLYITTSHFLQTIEGHDDIVDQLFAVIRRDDRHGEIQILEETFDCRARYQAYSIDFHADLAALVSQRRRSASLGLATVTPELNVG